jgi:hypothetical protein
MFHIQFGLENIPYCMSKDPFDPRALVKHLEDIVKNEKCLFHQLMLHYLKILYSKHLQVDGITMMHKAFFNANDANEKMYDELYKKQLRQYV